MADETEEEIVRRIVEANRAARLDVVRRASLLSTRLVEGGDLNVFDVELEGESDKLLDTEGQVGDSHGDAGGSEHEET